MAPATTVNNPLNSQYADVRRESPPPYDDPSYSKAPHDDTDNGERHHESPNFEAPARGALNVLLQVWHYTNQGRQFENNRRLAQKFQDKFEASNFHYWSVTPAPVREDRGVNLRDHFVPVEVEFGAINHDENNSPESMVRAIFARFAPSCVHLCFLDIGTAPQAMNIQPVSGFPAEHAGGYRHSLIINRLTIGVQSFVVPEAFREDADEIQTAFDGASDAIDLLLLLVNAYIALQPDFEAIAFTAVAQLLDARFLERTALPRIHVIRRLVDQLRGLYLPAQQAPVVATTVQEAWNQLCEPLQSYRRLMRRSRSALDALKSERELGNHDLHQLVHNMHAATLAFSEVKEATEPLLTLLREQHDATAKSYRNGPTTNFVTVAIVVAALCWWNPLGWGAGVVATAGGAGGGIASLVAAGTADARRSKAGTKCENASKAIRAVKTVDLVFNEARAAVAAAFCSQVLGHPLEEMGRHEKDAMLKGLGIDVDALEFPDYRAELIHVRVKALCDFYDQLNSALDQVLEDSGMELQTREFVR